MFSSKSQETVRLLDATDSTDSSPIQSPSSSLSNDLDDIKSNLSSKDIFRIANQSVDEFLTEIESKHQESEISLPELQQKNITPPQSPVTEPLNVDSSILNQLDNTNTLDNEEYDPDTTPTNIVHDDSVVFVSKYHELNGPKPPTDSPIKSPLKSPLKSALSSPKKSPKKVKIDDSPSKIHNYEVEKESEVENSDNELESVSQNQPVWSKVQVKPFEKESSDLATKFAHLPPKPLPQIVPSHSDYSIKSLPNMEFPNDIDTDNDDDNLDLPLANTSSPLVTRIAAPSGKRNLSSSAINQFHYDHDHYMQDMQSGNLVEPDDIKSNMVQTDKLKKDLLESDVKPLTEEMRNHLLNGFQNNSTLDRSNSVKSEMSISAADCLLKTKHLNTSLQQVNQPEEESIIRLNKEEEEEEDIYEDEVSSEEEDEPQELNNPKNRIPNNGHSRSTSLTDIARNIIGAFVKPRNVDPNLNSAGSSNHSSNTDLFHNQSNLRKTSLRNISAQSVATTVTDSGFVSASENFYYDNESDGIDDENNDYDHYNEENNNYLDSNINPDETLDTIVTPTNDHHSIPSVPQILQSVSSKSIHQETEKEELNSPTEDISSNNTSFSSADFVLHVPFEDDIFDTEFDEFNKSIQSRTVSTASSNGSNSKSRIVSVERADRNEVLNIWSMQRDFNLPTRKHTEFDSISAPIKSFIVSNNQPKAVNVINNTVGLPRVTSDRFTPSNWIYRKLEVLPTGVNKKLITSQSLDNTSTGFRQLSNSNIRHSISHTISHKFTPSVSSSVKVAQIEKQLLEEEEELEVKEDIIKEKLETLKDKAAEVLEERQEHNFSNVSGNSVLNFGDSVFIPDYDNFKTSISLDSNNHDDSQLVDNSILREIENWNPDQSIVDSANPFLDTSNSNKQRNDSNDILKQVWKNNQSNENLILNLTPSDTFKRLHGKELEHFLNKKRISSDEYHVKDATVSSARIQHDQFIPIERKASIYQFGNESYSKLVPELAIADVASASFYNHHFETQSTVNPSHPQPRAASFEFNLDNHDETIGNHQNDTLPLVHADLSHPLDVSAYEPPKSPVSPAREKMLAKFEEQKKKKKEQEAHKELQAKLQKKLRQEAQMAKALSPPIPSSPPKKVVKKRNALEKYDSTIDDMYEHFDNSPTMASFKGANLKPPGISTYNNDNPFESPKIKTIVKDDENNFNDALKVPDDDNKSINPFEKNVDNNDVFTDNESGNFEKISSTISYQTKKSSHAPISIKSKGEIPQFKLLPQQAKVNSDKLINGEQGRLFLKLQDVSGLKLPELKKRNAKFQLILDNGIHCIKTDFVEIGSKTTIPIGKEFELIVGEKLNIIITLKLKYDKPKAKTIEVSEKKKVKSKSMFGKLMGKSEMMVIKKTITQPPEEDRLGEYVAGDGSFSKLKIDFDGYKSQIFAKPSTYSLTCFNEWKTTKSEKGKVQNFKPIPICTLNMKMMFIPRSNANEVLPISINNAIAQLNQARKVHEIRNEGYMSQEGGDVELMTKRFFKLKNFDLFAYNISNNKLKAKINLKKVVEILAPDKKMTTTIASSSNNSGMKKTGKRDFTDVDGMILNHGFRIRFANNETISFGCDNPDDRDQWVNCVEQLMLLNKFQKQPWLVNMMHAMKDVSGNNLVV